MHQTVKEYYGSTLAGSADLKTDACCNLDDIPPHIKSVLALIHPEVSGKYYGCGLVAPELLAGMKILDLGSGSGQDCFVLSALVGEMGEIVGVDMTDEQLAVANTHVDFHCQAFGYNHTNVKFLKGYIEKLDELPLAANSFDIIVSNCVINLSPDKASVLNQAYQLLKPGGELYFSDVYADRRVPHHLTQDPVLYGECLSGALYWNDFINLAKQVGFTDPRLVSSRPLGIENSVVAEKIGHIKFDSVTCRLFKLASLEPANEDYGQAVIYNGTIEHCPEFFELDVHHRMVTGVAFPVCGNTWRMLHDTRFKPHFDFVGNFDQHLGRFEGDGMTVLARQLTTQAKSGCC